MRAWQFFVTFLGWLSDPFTGLSDLQLGDEKVTLNQLEWIFLFPPLFLCCQGTVLEKPPEQGAIGQGMESRARPKEVQVKSQPLNPECQCGSRIYIYIHNYFNTRRNDEKWKRTLRACLIYALHTSLQMVEFKKWWYFHMPPRGTLMANCDVCGYCFIYLQKSSSPQHG